MTIGTTAHLLSPHEALVKSAMVTIIRNSCNDASTHLLWARQTLGPSHLSTLSILGAPLVRWPLGPVRSGPKKWSDFRQGQRAACHPHNLSHSVLPRGQLKGVSQGHQQAHFYPGSILPPNELRVVHWFPKCFLDFGIMAEGEWACRIAAF